MRPARATPVALCLAALLVGAATPARADPPAASRPNTSGSDVVMLKNGGMLRGAISELVPNQQVTIVLITGEVRKVPMSEVSYAGPSSNAPASPSASSAPADQSKEPVRPLITVQGREVPVKFRASEPNLTFYLKTHSEVLDGSMRLSASGYDRICTAPCEAVLPAGKYQLGIAREDGNPVATDESIDLRGPSTVEGSYQSRAGVRVAGWVIIVAGVATSVYLISTAWDDSQDCSLGSCIPSRKLNETKVYGSLGIMLGAGIAWWIMSFHVADGVDVHVAPAVGGSRSPAAGVGAGRDVVSRFALGVGAPGLSLAATF